MPDEYAYIGRCEGCGKLVAAAMDRKPYRKDVAVLVMGWIRDGLIVERVESDVVREQFADCTCPRPEQLALTMETDA